MRVDAGEVGEQFTVRVELWPYDGPDDPDPSSQRLPGIPRNEITQAPLLVYPWVYRPIPPLALTAERDFDIVSASDQEESRTVGAWVRRDILDEDPGGTPSVIVRWPNGDEDAIFVPRADEIFARVTLTPRSGSVGESDYAVLEPFTAFS